VTEVFHQEQLLNENIQPYPVHHHQKSTQMEQMQTNNNVHAQILETSLYLFQNNTIDSFINILEEEI